MQLSAFSFQLAAVVVTIVAAVYAYTFNLSYVAIRTGDTGNMDTAHFGFKFTNQLVIQLHAFFQCSVQHCCEFVAAHHTVAVEHAVRITLNDACCRQTADVFVSPVVFGNIREELHSVHLNRAAHACGQLTYQCGEVSYIRSQVHDFLSHRCTGIAYACGTVQGEGDACIHHVLAVAKGSAYAQHNLFIRTVERAYRSSVFALVVAIACSKGQLVIRIEIHRVQRCESGGTGANLVNAAAEVVNTMIQFAEMLSEFSMLFIVLCSRSYIINSYITCRFTISIFNRHNNGIVFNLIGSCGNRCTVLAISAFVTLFTLDALDALLASVAFVTFVTLFTLLTLDALLASVAFVTFVTLFTLDASVTFIALVTLFTLDALVAFVTLVTLFTLLTLDALDALFASVAFIAFVTLLAFGSCCAGITFITFVALFTLLALDALFALVTFIALVTLRSRGPF